MKTVQLIKKYFSKAKILKFISKYAPFLLFKIPKLIWVGFALIGIFVFGLMLGEEYAYSPTSTRPTEVQKVYTQNGKYEALIRGYESMEKLYLMQGDNFAVLLDKNSLSTEPERVLTALDRIDQIKQHILIQQGRLKELRKAANLPEDPAPDQNQ